MHAAADGGGGQAEDAAAEAPTEGQGQRRREAGVSRLQYQPAYLGRREPVSGHHRQAEFYRLDTAAFEPWWPVPEAAAEAQQAQQRRRHYQPHDWNKMHAVSTFHVFVDHPSSFNSRGGAAQARPAATVPAAAATLLANAALVNAAAPGGGRRISGGSSTPSGSRLTGPVGICVHTGDGSIFVADGGNRRILRIAPDGGARVLAGGAASSAFVSPMYVALDAERGVLYVTDLHAVKRVRVSDGAVSTTAGSVEAAGNQDGPAAHARFYNLRGIAFDAEIGCLYVSDSSNHCIRRITIAAEGGGAALAVTTLAGPRSGSHGFRDGPGSEALFRNPCGLALLPDGSLAVADAENNAIRKIGRDGAVTTLAACTGK